MALPSSILEIDGSFRKTRQRVKRIRAEDGGRAHLITVARLASSPHLGRLGTGCPEGLFPIPYPSPRTVKGEDTGKAAGAPATALSLGVAVMKYTHGGQGVQSFVPGDDQIGGVNHLAEGSSV